MTRSFRAIVAAGLLVVTPLLSSCGDITEPVVTQTPTVQPQDGLLGGLLGVVFGLLGGLLGGPDANGPEAYAWIGVNGGTVKTAAYTLTVPYGAVTKSTKFVLKPANDGTYKIDLNAYQQGLLGQVNVGRYGFLKPVTLKMSYANAIGVKDPQGIIIVYVRTDGRTETQVTSVDTVNKTVSTGLRHFSRYAMLQD